MSGNSEETKEAPHKALPLDLARNQLTTVRTVDAKAPLIMTNQLSGVRVLTQAVPSAASTTKAPALITTAQIMPHAVFKQDTIRGVSQSPASITIQRPAQITLATTQVVAQTVPGTYHVPRGAAVVANLAVPRSNVASVRAPMVVTAQPTSQAFVRPPRTPSPAQGTAWLNTSNGAQKGAATVLSSPVRGATVTGKHQLVSRSQAGLQNVQTIRPGTILHSAITIGHSFKPGGPNALANVTLAQVMPARTQAVLYSASGPFTSAPRLTVTSTVPQRQPGAPVRPAGTAAQIRIPVNVAQSGARLVTPQATVLTSGARITPQSQTTAPSRMTGAQSLTIGRLSSSVAATNASLATRTLNVTSLVAVANAAAAPPRVQQAAKVVAQPAATGAIQYTPIKAVTTQNTTTTNRTTIVPAAIVSQRPTVVTTPLSGIYSQQQSEGQTAVQTTATANLYIHTPLTSIPRRSSPTPTSTPPATAPTHTTTTTSYSQTAGSYFYETSTAGNSTFPTQNRPLFGTQPTAFASSQSAANKQRYNPPSQSSMVVENRTTNSSNNPETSSSNSTDQALPAKLLAATTSSPRPSILRKRDHEGSPLKAAKNLTPMLQNLAPQQPPSPPPSRPDSRGNGHSSGGSTTISATSSPGLAEVNDDSMSSMMVMNKDLEDIKMIPVEMSPRKKPRKQQLTGSNDLLDMQFISENQLLKKDQLLLQQRHHADGADSDGGHSDGCYENERQVAATVRKPPLATLLNSYRQTWKATHNHYLRYSDVRPKDERRPTIMDLANQYRVQEKVKGWKVYHLSTQMEDLAEQEQSVYDQLSHLLKNTESQDVPNFDKDINRINELIKGNLQRIKIINDGMIEAKSQIMKIFDHKVHVTDIINRCASKRNFKKRDKS